MADVTVVEMLQIGTKDILELPDKNTIAFDELIDLTGGLLSRQTSEFVGTRRRLSSDCFTDPMFHYYSPFRVNSNRK